MVNMAIRSIPATRCLCDNCKVDIISGGKSCDFCHTVESSLELMGDRFAFFSTSQSCRIYCVWNDFCHSQSESNE